MKLFNNFINSINGLKIALREHSFKAEILLGFFIVPYVLIKELDPLLKIIILLTYFLLLVAEIVNTAIEMLCNKITIKYDKDIKKIKDLASASVFLILLSLIIEVFYSMLTKI
jgi:diacylglycerol kinase (ATP)